MSNPVVSIIMPVYNGGRYFSRSVPSVLAQEFVHWELIIVDDGSTDDTGILVIPFLGDPRISYHKKEHTGVGDTKNYGISLAHGAYVTFLDVDDAYMPTHLSARIAYMEKHNSIDVLHGGSVVYGNRLVIDRCNPHTFIDIGDTTQCSTIFTKKNIFDEHLYTVDYAEGSVLLENISEKFIIQKINFPTYLYYRDNPDSITNTIAKN